MTLQIDVPQTDIAQFCEKWQVSELALFGSVLRDDFTEASDIDVLVSFAPHTHQTLADLLAMERELAAIFRRRVDLGERRSVEQDPNYLRREHILNSAQVIYAD
ncbi:MAG: nucleotidyltransferase domain-containing protein [Anaerolineae bacterium]|nr:nucleotidyltransferase domain-containing protein [Anaerolineae bacterium]